MKPLFRLLLILFTGLAVQRDVGALFGQASPIDIRAQVKGPINSMLIRSIFIETHDGWSVDEVLLDDDRRETFLEKVRSSLPDYDEKEILESLIKLRKSGKLNVETTRRAQSRLDDFPAAEIAARSVQDQLGAQVDQILVDPKVRKEFDQIASSIAPDSTPYALRKAAIQLRKSRELQPELTLRVTDWKREIQSMSLAEAKEKIASFPKSNAVYLFRDKSGYLYIGQTNNLKERMAKHLADSDRRSLASYLKSHSESEIQLELHIFAADSPAKETRIREAYESELIRSRKPRLNIAP